MRSMVEGWCGLVCPLDRGTRPPAPSTAVPAVPLPVRGRGTMRSMVEGWCGLVCPLDRGTRPPAPSTAVPAVPLPVPGRIAGGVTRAHAKLSYQPGFAPISAWRISMKSWRIWSSLAGLKWSTLSRMVVRADW